MRKWLWIPLFILAVQARAQVVSSGVLYVTVAPSGACTAAPPIEVVATTGVPYTCNNGTWGAAGGGGSSGFPITIGGTSIAASSTTTAIDSLASLQNVKYLSAGSDIGAQCNTAVTALGGSSGTGIIKLPNSTNIPMSTTCTNIPPGISIQGYGKLASIINCTVAGDCFQFLQNPTTAGEIASEVAGFEINGSGASNQVLAHFNGASAYTLHDLQFEPYAGSGNAAICLEFDNSASGLFTERNRSYNVELERQCTTGVLFNKGAGTSSFGYNTFEFGTVSTGSNYGLVFNGAGVLYGGSLTVTANHVGPGGGIVQFNNSFNVQGGGGTSPGEHLFIAAEEDGSGSGIVLAATGTSSLVFEGMIINGGGGATALATLTSIAAGSNYHLFGASAASSVSTGNATSTTTVPGVLTVSACCGASTSVSGTLNLVPAGNPTTLTAPTWSFIPSNGANLLEFQVAGAGLGGSTLPFLVYGAPFAGNNAATGTDIPANAVYQWSSTNGGFAVDTGVSRGGAAVVDIGNGAQGDHSGSLVTGQLTSTAYNQSAASNSAGTCAMSTSTSCTITISHTYTTPVCITTQQSATLTGGAAGCTVSGTTVTITSAVANSETWGAFVFGNPN